MKLEVTHTTRYAYEHPVTLRPHVFRLRPRCDGALDLIEFEFEIDPKPSALTHCLDPEGNSVTNAWFEGATDHLHVSSRFEVETLRGNPFDYLLEPAAQTLPVAYPEALDRSLAAHCRRAGSNGAVADFANAIAKDSGWRTLEFLTALNTRLYETIPRTIREKGAPQPPELTLSLRKGSCRDLAVLFIDACRVLGIAARFVSGYQKYGANPERRYMHAWPEVFLPGGGWRGYDPTHGLAVADLHVAVAASREPAGAAPIGGAFCGAGVSSTMEARVEIR